MFFFKDELGEIVVKAVACGLKNPALTPLVANTVDASKEKHVPVVERDGAKIRVKVGSVEHPMEEAHRIEWVQLITDQGSYRKWLNPGQSPNVEFLLGDEKPLAVYAYCNLHGLWKTDLN